MGVESCFKAALGRSAARLHAAAPRCRSGLGGFRDAGHLDANTGRQRRARYRRRGSSSACTPSTAALASTTKNDAYSTAAITTGRSRFCSAS